MESQQSTVRAKIAATNAATTAHGPEFPSFDVWMSKKPPFREPVYGLGSLPKTPGMHLGSPSLDVQRQLGRRPGPDPRSAEKKTKPSRVLGGEAIRIATWAASSR